VTRRRAGGTRSFREPPTYGSAPRRATCISPSSGSAQSRPAGGGPSAGHRHLIPDRVAIQYPLATKGIPHRWQTPGRRRERLGNDHGRDGMTSKGSNDSFAGHRRRLSERAPELGANAS
jgi:hypothetical protein